MRENYDDSAKNSGSKSEFKVPFFNIKDGEKAIVRILVDSVDDLASYTYHEVELPDGSKKNVGCARALREDISKCPFCASGKYDVKSISYIHMLQYFPNSDGTMRVEARNWGKKPSFSEKSIVGQIRNALNEYGPLSDYVSSITRTGSGKETTYSLKINVPEKIYGPASNYPVDRSLFDDYSEDGFLIKNWTPAEMVTFMETGEVPVKQTTDGSLPFNPATAKPAYQNTTPNSVTPNVGATNSSTYQSPVNNIPNGVDDNSLPFNNSSYQAPAYNATMDDEIPFANAQTVGAPVNYGVPNQQPVMDRPTRRYQ